jgi:phage baseplate assembly protein W
MAFGAIRQNPNDLRPRVGIGVNLPLAEGTGFTSNYTTAEATKYNLINYFLTNPGERVGNPSFGGGLRAFIFEQINNQTTEYLKEDIQTKVTQEFPTVEIIELNVDEDPDANTVRVSLYYAIQDTNIEDEVILNFA